VAALTTIAAAKVSFVSRGDKSGIDALEKRLWKAAGLDPVAAAGNRRPHARPSQTGRTVRRPGRRYQVDN
jgi:tungstate transport system substrate-binding protein